MATHTTMRKGSGNVAFDRHLTIEFGQDAAIQFLIERLNQTEGGESYVLS